MKIRYGFVSNSSSSSFIISDPDLTTAKVMKEMVDVVKAEYKAERDNTPFFKTLYKISRWLGSNKDKDIPLLFPLTCNYETWIFRRKDSVDIVVNTCNNHDWDQMKIDKEFIHSFDEANYWSTLKKLKFLDLEDMTSKTYDDFYKKLFEKL